MPNTYEDVRAAAVEILTEHLKPGSNPLQFSILQDAVARVLHRRGLATRSDRFNNPYLEGRDIATFRDVFWDLFHDRIIVIGADGNDNFPFFRATEFGKKLFLGEAETVFHDVDSYIAIIRKRIPSIAPDTIPYLQEAMQAFRAGCYLSTAVMLGVASEDTIQTLGEKAAAHATYGPKFAHVLKEKNALPKLEKLKKALEGIGDKGINHGLDTNFLATANLIRQYRNESGHPSGVTIDRDEAFTLLHLFVPCCKKMYELMDFFK